MAPVSALPRLLVRKLQEDDGSIMRLSVTSPKDEPRDFADSGSSELPASYGRTRLVVLPIDPFHVHAYWEVTEKDRLAVMKRLDPMGASRLSWVLRFHDVSSGEVGGHGQL